LTALILDAEELSLLARGGPHESTVRAALVAAVAEAADVVVPAAVLAELYRGGGHDQAVDACLAWEGGIAVAPTDRTLARRIGHLLAAAGQGSAHHVDAALVAVCAGGGSVVLSGDATDLSALAGGSPAITVRGIK
jgi:hypothetical protein